MMLRSTPVALILLCALFCKGTQFGESLSTSIHTLLKQTTFRYIVGRVDVRGIDVFYQTAKLKNNSETKLPILFLHGAAFSSQTWRKLGTLRYFARHGYNSIAVDLPGYGKTKGYFRGNTNDFIDILIDRLNISRPILVSPSMSGRYSIPYVLQRTENLRGFIPVAPSNYGGTAIKFAKLNLPALIVYGSRDYYGRKTSNILAHIPGSKKLVIPNGSHPAYLDNPHLFHNSVKKFLDGIYAEEIQLMHFTNSTDALTNRTMYVTPTNSTMTNFTTV